MSLASEIEKVKKEAIKEISRVESSNQLGLVARKYLGKKGKLRKFFAAISSLEKKERRRVGKEVNKVKSQLEKDIAQKKFFLEKEKENMESPVIDITKPGEKVSRGHLHPLTIVRRTSFSIFQKMGFEIARGPEAETDWYNFEALNFSPNHPARDMHDTFFVAQGKHEKLSSKERYVLRTHTSPVQIHYMTQKEPPFRMVTAGKVFRNEATDASHEMQFYHFEGLMVGKEVSVANFKAVVQEFLKHFFRQGVDIRLRPSYFPFTEPSFEVDVSCVLCSGEGCSACSQTGWLELLGAGMVHPNVLQNSGVNSEKWQGFAFGVGIDRLAMMKYKIPDIRLFHSGDLRFLKQF